MIDLVYIATTLIFFALMLGYVRACERLGRSGSVDVGKDGTRSETSQS
jgi:hypothetical protein